MIKIKNPNEIEKMRRAGRLAAEVLDMVGERIRAGVSTEEINGWCHQMIVDQGAVPAPLNYRGYPKSVCVSINDVVCHGIPSADEIIKAGDIVNVDVTVILKGWHGDTSRMFMIGEVAPAAKDLVERTYEAMWRGIRAVRPGVQLSKIAEAIEDYVHPFGYAIVEDYGGHGIGRQFHEDPHVYHFRTNAPRVKLKPGMVFTVEPMINLDGSFEVVTSPEDGWTVRTKGGSLSAQFEHMVCVSESGYEVLTLGKYEREE